jgi:opacity protein-like surface antigen
MKNIRLLFLFNLFVISASAQRIHVGVFGGLAAYSGDLVDRVFPKKVTNGALGLTLNYEVSDQFIIRTGFTYAVVGGADRFSKDTGAFKRNLAFETSITEFSVVGEYYLLNLYDSRISPYAFAGLAVFHFDPYAYNSSNQKTFLKPLSTEGQGISGYPDRQPYKLTQVAIPFGGGVKFAVTDNLRVGVEMGIRKLFTDYLDDVSKNYIDPADLLAAKGQLAVDMSYRGDEVTGGSPVYPGKIVQRGNPKSKDYYYFTGIHLTYKFAKGMGGGGNGRKSRTGCPTNVY